MTTRTVRLPDISLFTRIPIALPVTARSAIAPDIAAATIIPARILFMKSAVPESVDYSAIMYRLLSPISSSMFTGRMGTFATFLPTLLIYTN